MIAYGMVAMSAPDRGGNNLKIIRRILFLERYDILDQENSLGGSIIQSSEEWGDEAFNLILLQAADRNWHPAHACA